jgi:hypothetical protein
LELDDITVSLGVDVSMTGAVAGEVVMEGGLALDGGDETGGWLLLLLGGEVTSLTEGG